MTASQPPIAPSASSSSGETILVDPAALTAPVWAECVRFLAPAIARSDGESTEASVLLDVARERAQLWRIVRDDRVVGAIVTSIVVYGSGRRVLLIQFAGGELEDVAPSVQRLEEFAAATFCDAVKIYGRKGWAKVLPEYRMRFVAFGKELRHGCQ